MRDNIYNTNHEREQELIEEAERQAHEDGLCNPATCLYHIDDRERGEESLGG